MLGIILAAGVGSRLRPMTNAKPKCLVTCAGKPLLQYQLDAYSAAGISDICIVVGYEGAAVRKYCKHLKDFNITIVENSAYEDSNNMYSLYLAKEKARGRSFILNNADLVLTEEIVSLLANDDRPNLVAVDVGRYNDESMKVELNDNNYIVDISKTVSTELSHGCSIDFYKFSASAGARFFEEIDRIIEVEKNLKDWTEIAMQRLFKSQTLKFGALDISDSPWVEVDNYEDLAIADKIFSQREKSILEYQHFCLDLDGTVYVEGTAIQGAIESVNQLKARGKTTTYLSNNSSKNKSDYSTMLTQFGIETTVSDIILSTDSMFQFLTSLGVKRIFVLGTESLIKAAIEEGFEFCSVDPEFLVIGYDTELTYAKLATACGLINRGVDFVATHCDQVCPSSVGPIPDAGLLTSMIENTTGKKAYKIFGKPNIEMINDLCRGRGWDKDNVLIVGDRLYTDIAMGNNSGIDSLLVLSGDTSRDKIEDSAIRPTYILNSIADIF